MSWAAALAALLSVSAAQTEPGEPAPSAESVAGEETSAEAAPGEAGSSVRASLKSTVDVFRAPYAPWLYPEQTGAAALWRLRIYPELRISDSVSAELAYEQRLQVESTTAIVLPGLPRASTAPYRLVGLEDELASTQSLLWLQELDRAFVAAQLGPAQLSVGRQAIGWGRGMVFTAVDLFSPFSPLEVDREWRRGVDAVRADVRVTERFSVDAVAALGPSIDDSLLGARARGFAGDVDAELLGGWRAQDTFAGGSLSAAVGGVELHTEGAVFHLPTPWPESAVFGRNWIPRTVIGGSYVAPVGTGLTLAAEYQYSGFGVAQPEDLLIRLADPDFQKRYLRGDFQLLGRHTVGVLTSYELGLEGTTSLMWLQDAGDGSGILAPSMTWNPSDRLSVLLTGYVPYGRKPDVVEPVLHSQFGTVPLAVYLQVQVTDGVSL